MASDMVKDHGDGSKGTFYMYHSTDRISHITAFGIPVVEHWPNSDM